MGDGVDDLPGVGRVFLHAVALTAAGAPRVGDWREDGHHAVDERAVDVNVAVGRSVEDVGGSASCSNGNGWGTNAGRDNSSPSRRQARR